MERVSGRWDAKCSVGHGKGVEMENAKLTQKQRMAEEERPRTKKSLRYVDVLWLIFMFSNFNWLDSTLQNFVAWVNLRWKICKDWTEVQTSLDLVMIIRITCCWFLKRIHRSCQLHSPFEFKVVFNIWKCGSVFFNCASLWCLPFYPHWITSRLNLGVRLREWAT